MTFTDQALEKWLSRDDAKVYLDERVEKVPSGCWIWVRALGTSGYGKLSTRVGSRNVSLAAHRLAFVLYHGRIPPGMAILHTCDVPACCNPEHLVLGTQHENVQDMLRKGRKRSQLEPHQVQAIRDRASLGEPQVSIAKDFPVSKQTVSKIVRRDRWRCM